MAELKSHWDRKNVTVATRFCPSRPGIGIWENGAPAHFWSDRFRYFRKILNSGHLDPVYGMTPGTRPSEGLVSYLFTVV
jgi:hypothetical protein